MWLTLKNYMSLLIKNKKNILFLKNKFVYLHNLRILTAIYKQFKKNSEYGKEHVFKRGPNGCRR